MERPIEKFLKETESVIAGCNPGAGATDAQLEKGHYATVVRLEQMVKVFGDGSVADDIRPRTADEKQRWLTAILAAIVALLQSLTAGQAALLDPPPASAE